MEKTIIMMSLIVAVLSLTTTLQHEIPSIGHAMKRVISLEEVSMGKEFYESSSALRIDYEEISLPESLPNLLLAHEGETDENGCHNDDKGRWH